MTVDFLIMAAVSLLSYLSHTLYVVQIYITWLCAAWREIQHLGKMGRWNQIVHARGEKRDVESWGVGYWWNGGERERNKNQKKNFLKQGKKKVGRSRKISTCQSDKTPPSSFFFLNITVSMQYTCIQYINNHKNSLEVDCLFWYCSRTHATWVSTLFAR